MPGGSWASRRVASRFPRSPRRHSLFPLTAANRGLIQLLCCGQGGARTGSARRRQASGQSGSLPRPGAWRAAGRIAALAASSRPLPLWPRRPAKAGAAACRQADREPLRPPPGRRGPSLGGRDPARHREACARLSVSSRCAAGGGRERGGLGPPARCRPMGRPLPWRCAAPAAPARGRVARGLGARGPRTLPGMAVYPRPPRAEDRPTERATLPDAALHAAPRSAPIRPDPPRTASLRSALLADSHRVQVPRVIRDSRPATRRPRGGLCPRSAATLHAMVSAPRHAACGISICTANQRPGLFQWLYG